MPNIACDLPAELLERPQWLLWRIEQREGKPTKVPYQPRQRLVPAKTNDPRTWASYETAIECWRYHGTNVSGIGFVFTKDDPLCGVDLDACFPSDAAECAPWAAGILERFNDTYSEESPSGTGVKIWCRAQAPRCGRWLVGSGAIEVYDHLRYFAVTGRHAGVLTIADHQVDIAALVEHLEAGRGDAGRVVSIPTRLPGSRSITPYRRSIDGVIRKGTRHPTLVSLAGSMWSRGMDEEAVEAALLVVNVKQCDPPYSPAHIRKIVGSMRHWAR